MSGNPLDKRRDTRTSGASCIAGCGRTEIQHNLNFVDDEGQLLPAAGARYRLQVPHGAAIYGVLDNNGYASHNGVGFGTVLYDIEPDIDTEKKLILKEIKQAMDAFLTVEHQESEKIKARMQDLSAPEQDREYTKAMGKGAKDAAVGAFEAVVDLSVSVGKEALHLLSYFNPLAAPYAYERDVARVKQAKKELQAISDADWKLYATLINDNETQKLFWQFAKDYLDAQHGLEITEGTTEVITVILGIVGIKSAAAISTTGTGTSKLAQLGGQLVDPIKRLIDVLKRAQAKKKVKGDGNQRIVSEVHIEDNKKQDNSEPETKTVYRVDEDDYPRIIIDDEGNVEIPVVKTRKGKGQERDLFINIDQPERAETFLKRRIKQGKPAQLKSVKIDKKLADKLQKEAVLESDLADNPGSPVKVDLPIPDQYGLKTPEQIEEFRRAITKGSGKIVK